MISSAFSKDQLYCVLDYETYSEADLKKVGAYEYSMHPSTEIICLAWRVGTRDTLRSAKTYSTSDTTDQSQMTGLIYSMLDRGVILVAHNALFEQVITKNVLAKSVGLHALSNLPPSRWLCTASLASALAIPRNLEGAAHALKLPVQKDMDGRRLILKWCKPRKPTKHDPSTRHTNKAELARLVEYCERDVDAEVELFLTAPPLNDKERAVWELDQTINMRGFLVDRPLVHLILGMIAEETERINEATREKTFGVVESANQRQALLEWLEFEGITLPNLQKATLEKAILDKNIQGIGRDLLEFRRAVSKTSTAKYAAFDMRSKSDSRLRDTLVYHSASTGRWGGAGVQPQNFPRGTVSITETSIDIVRSCDMDLIKLCFGDPMQAFSSVLRGMIVAPEGRIFDVADYASIEVRVLFWVAGHEKGLQLLRRGVDLYKDLATQIYKVELKDVTPQQRFVGKEGILGCGYSMGGPKFHSTVNDKNIPLSVEEAKLVVSTYRRVHHPVVELWRLMNDAAVAATLNPGIQYKAMCVTWVSKGGFLWCLLPSGRKLAYYGPGIRYDETPWGEPRATPYHWGVDSITGKWVTTKTYGGKLVENVVQAIARDLMVEAMLRIEATQKWEIVLTVHDELIAERVTVDVGTNEEFCDLMATVPDWAQGCPIKVEGWESKRYRK